ncbi:hypothetical protein [Streptomyces lonarensis]|uniref:hypothetical protein n=1 Tax=Streptomyces lonarensis TaxID=700599 RepID=UPI0030C6B32B
MSPEAPVDELASALKSSLAVAGVPARVFLHQEKGEFLCRADRVAAAALIRALRAAARAADTAAPALEALVWCRRARRVGIVRGVTDGMVDLEAFIDGTTFRSPAARLVPATLSQMRAAQMLRARHPRRKPPSP